MYTPRAPSRGSHTPHSVKQISKITATIASARRTREPQDSLRGVPLEIQEAFILEDLLFVLMGIPGTYITYHPDYIPEDGNLRGATFVVSEHLDASLRDLIERILPLATYYTGIAAFIEFRSHTDYGLVNHALCAAIRDMLKEYLTLISQLEHAFVSSSTFTLQKLWFYVHPTLHTLSILYTLITELVRVEDPEHGKDGSDDDEDDDEDDERNKALGLGGLKAVIKDMLSASSGLVKGGEVVTILWERMRNNSGDPTTFQVYRTLLHRASLPYTQMIKIWSTAGHLRDPYDELMVKETKSINRGTLEMDFIDEYWEKRYTLRDGTTIAGTGKRPQAGVPALRTVTGRLPGGACIPPLLEGWKHKILLSGKYLNVIRECGIDIPQVAAEDDEEWVLDGEKFYKGIEDAYAFANRTLLKLLLEDQQLLPRLRAMKHYFFLSQASFLTHFLELAGPELRKPPKNAPLVKLQSLLDLSLNMNFSGEEVAFKYKEDVKVSIATSGLYDWLLKVVSLSGFTGFGTDDGGETDFGAGPGAAPTEEERKKDKDKEKKLTTVEVLAFDFIVPFPLSLVVSRKAILRYQLLFRFILHLKHIEQCLAQMWIDQKSPTWKLSVDWHPDLEKWRRRVTVLRARMLAVVQQILGYATTEVLEPNWRSLEAKLGKVLTVDQLLRDHVDFLDTCLKECMLTNAKILKIHAHLLQTCFTFSQYSYSFNKQASQIIDAYTATGEIDIDDQHLSMEKRWAFLHKFEHNFNHYFKIHHDCVQFLASSENTALLALVVRLNNIRTP